MAENVPIAKTVVALFRTEADAGRAAAQLIEAGYTRDQVGVVAGHELSHPELHVPDTENSEGKVMGAIGKGVGLGGSLGALAGALSSLLIPGFGPLVIGGAIASTFMGAGLGGAVGGVMAGLMKAGVDESDARLFEAALRHGGVVLTVHTDELNARQAAQILQSHGAVDMDEHKKQMGDRGVDHVEGATNDRVSDMR